MSVTENRRYDSAWEQGSEMFPSKPWRDVSFSYTLACRNIKSRTVHVTVKWFVPQLRHTACLNVVWYTTRTRAFEVRIPDFVTLKHEPIKRNNPKTNATSSVKDEVFWCVTQWSVVAGIWKQHGPPKRWYVTTIQHTASQPRRPQLETSPPWKPETRICKGNMPTFLQTFQLIGTMNQKLWNLVIHCSA
jgi:hypothetical protein